MKATLRQLFLALCLLLAPLGLSAQTLVFHLTGGAKSTVSLPATFTVTPQGDKLVIDSDGTRVELSDGDVTCVTYRAKTGDVNGDQTVDVADIATVISIMAGYKPGGDDNPVNTGEAPEGVEAVDLGLPSGTKWANMNVGATAQNEYGLFFAWGETRGYSSADTSDGRSFDWASYKWMAEGKSSWMNITKYQIADNETEADWYDTNYRFIGDGKATLDLEDDAARANWGGDWRMPTYDEIKELVDNTTSEWTTLKGVQGRKFTSKTNGNSIFLPAAGYRGGSSLVYQSSYGVYWSSSVGPSRSGYARYLDFSSGHAGTSDDGRVYGFSVRPVLRN